MATKENLESAFAGESQANRRYLAFARKADEEGKPNIARLFRAAAEAETVHAHNHLNVLGEVRSTGENLDAAINGENYEHTKMYPGFIEEARSEGNSDAEHSFDHANQVERIHESHFRKALDALGSGRDLEEQAVHVCPVCGNTFVGDAPGKCPICHTPRERFVKIK
jgi:rubrerythrin